MNENGLISFSDSQKCLEKNDKKYISEIFIGCNVNVI